MTTIPFANVYENLLDYLVEKATPDEILAFQPSAEDQQRTEELSEKNNAGTITSLEQQELQQILEVNALVSLLRAKALQASQ